MKPWPGDLAGGHLRVDPQANADGCAIGRRMIEDQPRPFMLEGRIEDHVIGEAADFLQLLRLERGGIGRDLAIVELTREPRFPQTGGGYAVEILPDNRRRRPHRERLQRGKHLDVRAVGRRCIAHLGQHPAIGAQLGRVHDEGGAIHPRQIELGESARITGFGLHQPSGLLKIIKAPPAMSAKPASWLGPGVCPNRAQATNTKPPRDRTS